MSKPFISKELHQPSYNSNTIGPSGPSARDLADSLVEVFPRVPTLKL